MARIYEYQAKEILGKFGIAVPRGRSVASADEAAAVAREISGPVVVKAQVWASGRYAAGGIKFAETPQEAERGASLLLGAQIKGLKVERVLVEEKLAVAGEVFAGITVSDSYKIKGPVLIFSSEGGSSIEEVAARNPERIAYRNVDYLVGVDEQAARTLVEEVEFAGWAPSAEQKGKLARIVALIYGSFVEYDARAVEVNPIIITDDGRILAADCHFTLDDNSVFRHRELEIQVPRDMDRPPTELERMAWLDIEEGDYRGTGYFSQMVANPEGEGWLGFHGIGGGGAMLAATGFVARGFKIASYADTSGDPPASKIYAVMRYILSLPIDGYVLMGACLANQEQWHHAHALVKALKEEAGRHPGFPVVILLAGNKEEEAHKIIRDGLAGLPLRWELYGRRHIYDTDFIADRVQELVKAYQAEKVSAGREAAR